MRHPVSAFDLTSILEKGTFNMQFKELILRKQYRYTFVPKQRHPLE